MNEKNIGQVDLNLLVSLDRLLQETSVSRAAKQLALSQSAMSHQLRRLRELFDDRLLVVRGGGLAKTPLAERLEAPMRRALGDLWRAIHAPGEFNASETRRTFCVATNDIVQVVGVSALVQAFSVLAPHATLVSRSLGSDTVELLARGSIDLTLGPTVGVGHPEIRRETLHSSDWVCVLRRGHPAARGRLTEKKYFALDHIAAASHEAEWPLDRELVERGKERRVVVRVNGDLSALHIAATSDLALTMPRDPAERIADRVDVVLRALPFDGPRSSFVMSWHGYFDNEPASVWLRSLIRTLNGRLQNAK